ncbi:MAG: tyrosine-type recombinase/integrase [Gordonia sp. (in: high G+C Gram-positive bacteria)]|uniref:site-specific integrase n=1 Tax=Gordonia sp. (in: high G+C Gram-positive bacteria) TaxID=84139 RepID=UPI0039E2244D
MGRPPLPVGTYGNINTRRLPDGRVIAQTWVRDTDGRRRRVERRAKTKTAAIHTLKEALVDRRPPSGVAEIAPTTRVEVLAEHWLRIRAGDGVRRQTLDHYEDRLGRLVYPYIGHLQLREVSTSRIQAMYDDLGAAKAAAAASPLRQVLDVAVRCDVYPANPARQARPPGRVRAQGVVLTAAQLIEIRASLSAWAAGDLHDSRGPSTPGITRRAIPDFFDLAVATGARPSELLAFRYDDLDLDADPPTITVTGTLVALKGTGTVRQPFAKSESGHRVLALPRFAEQVIRDRLRTRRPGVVDDVIFPGASGGYMPASSVRTEWRHWRTAAGHPGLEIRAIRRSIATLIAAAEGSDAAAAQLGHADTAVTETYYIAKTAAVAPDLTALLQTLA